VSDQPTKAGLYASAAMHAALLGFLIFGFAFAPSVEDAGDSIPVEAVTQNQLTPAGNPRIEPQTVDEGQDLTYIATFEVFPEVALQPIEALEIPRVVADVTDSDVDAMIERLRKQQMKFTPTR